MEKNRIVIFGAGRYGNEAYKIYGEDVSYFVDNNPAKCGKRFNDKTILSFDEYLKIADEYYTIIAVNAYQEIAKQLREAGVYNFGFYSPRFSKSIKQLSKFEEVEKVVVYGIDDYTSTILSEIKRALCNSEIMLSSKEGGTYLINGENVYVNRFENIEFDNNTLVVIACSVNSAAADVYCKRIVAGKSLVINLFIQTKYYDTDEIIFSPYGDDKDGGNHTESEWNDSIQFNAVKDEINEYVKELDLSRSLFEHVEIETINRCNGVCDFCPVSAGNDVREKRIMDEKLFFRIIDQLADINYSGRLALFSNNEPFLDKRIIEFHKYARGKLPNARMHIFTNGTLLTLEKFLEIVEYLDEIIIDNYDSNLELIDNVRNIKNYCDTNQQLKSKVTIVLRNPHEILTSRGGDAPNRKAKKSYPDIMCALPYKQMIIRPDGKVSLCCNDPYGRCTMGDLNNESLVDVWNGESFSFVRKKLMNGRGALSHCEYCDTFITF